MKIPLILTLSIAFLIPVSAFAQAPQAAPTGATISITIKATKTTLTVGADVEVQVEMKNISSNNIFYPAARVLASRTTSFSWEVRDSGGKPVPMTPYGIKANHIVQPQAGVAPIIQGGVRSRKRWSLGRASFKSWL
jgi:hypothetical protein